MSAFNIFKGRINKYTCPVCKYYGPFTDINPDTGCRKYALCPKCGSLERHRLQHLVINRLAVNHDFSKMRMLHFAPEEFFRKYFKKLFGVYTTADLNMHDVDYQVDITKLPFKDAEYDFIFASHVLEHIKDDLTAISEMRRVLKPAGIAILPVPIVSEETIEYPEPNPFESGHVRAPSVDYYERYRKCFSRIELSSSNDYPSEYQTFLYEDRSNVPNEKFPLRRAMAGERHIDIVPICFA